MSFVLKIVEGPNTGAEAALVEGVAVTLGKNDECDIVLADASLPNVPVKIETTAEGVSIDGELMVPLHVKTLGDTSLAIGPANEVWGKLVWPEKETAVEADKPAEESPAPEVKTEEEKPAEEKKSSGCLIWFIVLLLLSASLAGIGYYYRDRLMPKVEPYRPQAKTAWDWTSSHAKGAYGWCSDKCVALYGKFSSGKKDPASVEPEKDPAELIAEIALAHGLDITEVDGSLALTGNLKTRAERLAVTAEAYAVLPCVELNLSDDETLKTAVEDTLGLIGESGVQVKAVTNRVAVLEGRSANFPMVVTRISQEVPKITTIVAPMAHAEPETGDEAADAELPPAIPQPDSAEPKPNAVLPQLPVCGILTSPYPCLVTRSGMRIMEGASIGEWTVRKIEADSVTLTNDMGRFTWKP